MKAKESTQSVRINKDVAKRIKLFAVRNGASIKAILEYGAGWAMTDGKDQTIEHIENYKSK